MRKHYVKSDSNSGRGIQTPHPPVRDRVGCAVLLKHTRGDFQTGQYRRMGYVPIVDLRAS